MWREQESLDRQRQARLWVDLFVRTDKAGGGFCGKIGAQLATAGAAKLSRSPCRALLAAKGTMAPGWRVCVGAACQLPGRRDRCDDR